MAVERTSRKLTYRDSPKYERLKEQLLSQFALHQGTPGQALPSEPDLARYLGVARGTVRRALAGLERDGIVKRIRGKGTFVSPLNKPRPREQLEVFAILLPEIRRDLYPSLVKGLDMGANRLQHQLIVCNTDYDIGKQADFVVQLIEKQVAGIALVPTTIPQTPAHQINHLQGNGIPVVFCHRPVPGAKAPLVTWDWREVGRIAAAAIVKHGHQHVGYFGVYRYPLTIEHEQGLREVLESHGLMLPESYVHYGENPPDHEPDAAKHKALEQMLARPERPTAIFCSDDTEAESIYMLCAEIGLKIPRDLSLVSFGTPWRIGPVRQRLTAVLLDEYELGIRAAELLFEMSEGRRPIVSEETILMPLTLNIGESLAQAPS